MAAVANQPPLDKIFWKDDLGQDRYGIWTNAPEAVKIVSGTERFELVSSLYGPGNLACWFFLLTSVLVSWTINPSSARKYSITNDFIAALCMPVVAAAHFFHQVYQQSARYDGKTGLHGLFTTPDRDNIRAVAAIEAPLTVCEDFITWAAILCFVARKRQPRRTSLVLAVCSLCLSVEVLLWFDWVPFQSSLLLRPFMFHLIPYLGILLCWHTLTVLVYLVEVLSVMISVLKKTTLPEVESGTSLSWRLLWPGRFSSWMAGCSALVAGFGTIWIKYGWVYMVGGRASYNSVRLVPRSTVGVWDLDQVVCAVGGLVTLLFSLLDAFKEQKKAKTRINASFQLTRRL